VATDNYYALFVTERMRTRKVLRITGTSSLQMPFLSYTNWREHCSSHKVQQVLPKVIWEEPYHNSSQQRMNPPTVCASRAMPTADKSAHSAASTLHPHHTDRHTTTAYIALA